MALARSIGALFSRFARWSFPGRNAPTDPAHRLGWEGERLAAAYLRRHGFKILYRNYRPKGGGEIDLVCRDKAADTLVFVEVKTRRGTEFGRPGDAVNAAKRRLIVRGAVSWLRLLHDDEHRIVYRFDIVEIVMRGSAPEITHLPDAFPMPERIRA